MRTLLTLLFLLGIGSLADAQMTTYTVSANRQPNTRTNVIAVPNGSSATIVTTKNADVFNLIVINTQASTIWFTAQCNDGTPFVYQAAIPANSTIPLPIGVTCSGGFAVNAQSSGLNFQAFWRQ